VSSKHCLQLYPSLTTFILLIFIVRDRQGDPTLLNYWSGSYCLVSLIHIIFRFFPMQALLHLALGACMAAVQRRPVLHHHVVTLSASS